MVQKILDNEIINKYKVNRCIPTIPKKTINNNLNGGALFGFPFGVYKYIFLFSCLILIGVGLKASPSLNMSWEKISLVLLIGTVLIFIEWFINEYSVKSLNKETSLQEKILYFILGTDAKITQFHKVIFFSVLVFLTFIIINISAILLIKLLKGDSDNCLKNLKLSRLSPLKILSDNSENTKDILNRNGVGRGPVGNPPQPTNITVDNDYFDLNNFIKPPLVKKESTVSQDAGIIFNPNNINQPGVVNQGQPQGGPNAALINIGTGNNTPGSIFDNRIKVVDKDIYEENEYFKTRPEELVKKLKKYFQYIYDKTEKRHFIAFEIRKEDIVNTPYGNILAS